MMMFSPIIGMIHNERLDRWHPVIFEEKPLPGPSHPDKPVRHKSKGHHTEGFSSREEAVAYIENSLISKLRDSSVGEIRTSLDKDLPWDGEGIPAMVEFFSTHEGKTVPTLNG